MLFSGLSRYNSGLYLDNSVIETNRQKVPKTKIIQSRSRTSEKKTSIYFYKTHL